MLNKKSSPWHGKSRFPRDILVWTKPVSPVTINKMCLMCL